MVTRRTELENRIEELQAKIRQLEEEIEDIETTKTEVDKKNDEIISAKTEISRKLEKAAEAGAAFRMVRSIRFCMQGALEGKEYSDMMEGIYGTNEEVSKYRVKLIDDLDECYSALEASKIELNSLPAEDVYE